jgi:hypothetical protein
MDLLLIGINIVDVNLLFFIAVFFIFFALFTKDILCFVYNLKEIDSADTAFDVNKSRLSLLTPFRFFFSTFIKKDSRIFSDYIQHKHNFKSNTKTNNRP